ncbi:MAG: DUF427 domain-containing protein [Solirubrobacteraceae bacterium]
MENVWDYPRPPSVEPCPRRVRLELGGVILADSSRALRVLETSHPPTIYVPPGDVRTDALLASAARPTVCEFKGVAQYLDAELEARSVPAVGWTYPAPTEGYRQLRDHIAFFPGRVDRAWLGEELIEAQEGDFYGGWISADLVGPFKGGPGTIGW